MRDFKTLFNVQGVFFLSECILVVLEQKCHHCMANKCVHYKEQNAKKKKSNVQKYFVQWYYS